MPGRHGGPVVQVLGDDRPHRDDVGGLVGDVDPQPGLSEEVPGRGLGLPHQGGDGGVPGAAGDQQPHDRPGLDLLAGRGVGAGDEARRQFGVGHDDVVAYLEPQAFEGGHRVGAGLSSQVGDGDRDGVVGGEQEAEEDEEAQAEHGHRGQDADDQRAAVGAARVGVGRVTSGSRARGQRGPAGGRHQAGGCFGRRRAARHAPGEAGHGGAGGGCQGLPGEEPGQVAGQGAGVLVAPPGVLLQAAHHDGVEGRRDVRVQVGGRRGELPHVLVGHRDRALPDEGGHPGEQLVHHHAQGVEVGAAVGGEALGLLGAEVGGGADDRPGASQLVGVVPGPGDAEVGDLDGALGGEQHVGRLDVAVHQAAVVGGAQGGGDAGPDLGHPAGLQRPFGPQQLAQVLALDELHDHVVDALVAPPVVDVHDVDVVEVGGRLGLPPEALDEALVGGVLRVEDLDGHPAVEETVVADPHVGHPAARQVGDEGIATREDPLTVHWFEDGTGGSRISRRRRRPGPSGRWAPPPSRRCRPHPDCRRLPPGPRWRCGARPAGRRRARSR